MYYFFMSVILTFLALISVTQTNDEIKYTPKNFCVRLTTNTSAVIQWFEPVTLRDEIMGYKIYYTRNSELPLKDWDYKAIGNYPLATIRNIELGEVYTFRIRLEVLNFEGPGPISDDYNVEMVNRTRSCYDQPKSSTIRSLNVLRAAATSYTSVEVWWNVPYDPHLHTGYCITYGINNSQHWQNLTVGLVQSAELSNLQESGVYTISLAVITKTGLDYCVQDVVVKVLPEEVPLDVAAYDITSNSLCLKWSPPTHFHPFRYTIAFEAFKEYEDSTGMKQYQHIPKVEHGVNGYTTNYCRSQLYPNTNYNINVTAVPIDHSYRPASKITAKTTMTAPHPLVKPDLSGTGKGGNPQIILPKASEEFGNIGHYYIIVVPQKETEEVPSNAYLIEELTKTNSHHKVSEESPYIAAKFERKIPYAFIVGNGDEYGGYKNHKLTSGVKYRMFVRAVVDNTFEELYTDSPYSDVFYLDMPELKSRTQNVIGR